MEKVIVLKINLWQAEPSSIIFIGENHFRVIEKDKNMIKVIGKKIQIFTKEQSVQVECLLRRGEFNHTGKNLNVLELRKLGNTL